MRNLKALAISACLAASIAIAPAARAQWAVIDAPAIAQLIQEVQTMAQQLATARNQLQSAQQALQAMTATAAWRTCSPAPSAITCRPIGRRSRAFAGAGDGGYAGLSADVQSTMSANAVLSPQRLADAVAGRSAANSGGAPVERHAAGSCP